MSSAKNITAVYPISPTQKGMLFYLINAEIGDINYREQLNFIIPNSVSTESLKTAWQTIINRHPVLRSIYSWENKSQPLQAVLSDTVLQWQEHDLRSLQAAQADEFIEQQQNDMRQSPLQLNKKPPVSFEYFILNEQHNLLTFNFTHLQLDGWSMALISNEVELVLAQLAQGKSISLAPAGEYKDYINWLMAQNQQESISYWQNQLQDIEATLPLKLAFNEEKQRENVNSKNSDFKLTFSDEQQQEITDYCRNNGVTLNAFMLAAFGLLNNQITHRNNSIIGSVVAGRPSTVNQIEQIAGFFSNALPVAVNAKSNQAFNDWLKKFQQSLVSGWDHSYIALEQIKQSLGMSITDDLFSTLFIFQNFPKRLVEPEAQLSPTESIAKVAGEEQSHYPLTLYVMASDELNIYANFNSDIYNVDEISELLKHYQQLMLNCIRQCEQPAQSILSTSEQEKNTLIQSGQGTSKAWSKATLTQALNEIATDNANALTLADKTWNYQTLSLHINGMSNELSQQGIGPGHRVAIILSRSFEFVVSCFAVLKVGASYVPIDPKMPANRQRYICEDANINLIINEQVTSIEVSSLAIKTLAVNALKELTSESAITIPVDNFSEAYVIYTSGSTGVPKGVSISRGALLNHTNSAIDAYNISQKDTGLQFSSLSFDTAIEEIYPIIFQSGHLVLRDDNIMASSDEFINLIEKHQISILNFPTAFWTNWVSQLNQQNRALPSCTRLLIIGGEEALTSTLSQWQEYCDQHHLSILLFNTYGPTEATVVTTRIEMSHWKNNSTRLPIGTPIDNVDCYIVNSCHDVLPDGFIGELAITGQGLATHYLNNEQLTAERFINTSTIGRAYLTGDLGYYHQGNLYYLGRKDHQLKIRGYRVELGEVEQALSSHSQIKECLVTAYNDHNDTLQLAGYYCGNEELSTETLRKELLAKLPDYMIPQTFIFLEELPRTLTGKYDRKQLPAPKVSALNIDNLSDTFESNLAVIWSKLLGASDISPFSNFFHLGGHSILTVKLIGEIRKAFAVELIFNEIFNNPSLKEMATLIKQRTQGKTNTRASLPKLTHQEGLTISPLSFQQERVWFLQQLHKENTAYNFQMSFFLEGELNVQFLTETLQEIVERQQLWHCTFHSENGVPYQKVETPFTVDLTPVDMSQFSEDEQTIKIKELLTKLSQTAFDITQLPLIRWKLVKLSQSKHCLLQVEHHLIHDGWSVGLFFKEMQTIYEAKMQQKQHQLQPLKYSYNDFCVWQREALSGEYYQEMEAYWLKKLDKIPSSIGLPYDFPRPQSPTFEGESMMFNLDVDLYEGLRTFGKENGYTLYMTMLAAYYVLLFKYSGQDDINIGAGTASRTIPELHPIMGMMVNSIVLRTDLSGEPTFLELLNRVRETCLNGYTYQDMPFEKLVQKLSPERMGHANPLFQTMFSFHDAEVPEPDFGNLRVKGQVNTNKSAKLDLNVIVAPHAEQRVGKKSTRKAVAVMTWEYSTDLFTQKTMEEMVDNFLAILQQTITTPDIKITELEIVREETAKALLAPALKAAQYKATYPCAVPSLFDQQVQNASDATAVVEKSGKSISYLQLQQRSIQFANHLKQQGATAGDVIGLAIEKGSDLYAMMIAVMRLDCRYAPIDLSAGDLRLSAMLNNLVNHAKQPLLVVNQKLDLPTEINQIHIEKINEASDESLLTPFDFSSSESDAYILYTSGSTGLPKGASINQKGILRLVNQPNYIQLTAKDIWLQHSSVYFDASVLEIWAPLLNGGKIIVPKVEKLTMQQLTTIIEQHQVSHLWLTAGLFHHYADYKQKPHQSLKYLLAGGDVLSPEKVRLFLNNNADCTLINGYGPTENTTFSYCKSMTKDTLSKWKNATNVPIGSAISGTRGYVLNNQGQLCPQGAIGELYLAGDGLASGYLEQSQTQAAFSQKQFIVGDIEVNERLYKTGDMVRYNQDDELEFIGRKDTQIKLRGFRVELNEIEEVINQHPQVKQSCVLVKEDEQGNKHLIACYQANTELSEELQTHCQQLLLAHQIPALFGQIDEFPLTANGKLDRNKILQRNEFNFSDAQGTYAEPESELEQILCEIWQQALNVEQVGTTDNFFRLGGHSLIAVNVLAQISDKFAVDLDLADLFKSPSIKGIVKLISQYQDETEAKGTVQSDNTVEETLAEDLSDDALDALLATMEGDE